MRKLLSILFLLVLVASMVLPQIAVADGGRKGEVVTFAAGTAVVVDNNVDVTYTGRTWKDAQGNNKYEYVARISQAPIYNDDGSAVDCSWHGMEDAYAIVNNVFSAQVIGAYITTTYQGQSMSWNPIVMVDSKEYVAKGSPKVLAVDPINENYQNNTLEWDYGVCVRRVRVIEGLIQETWIFDRDPKGTVWIKDNAQKSAGFTWAIAPYAFDADGNNIPINQYKQVMAKDMANAVYPVTIDPTEVYVTSASDGNIYNTGANINSSTGYLFTNGQNIVIGYSTDGYVYRSFYFFDTSALPDSATISAANLSLYGYVDHTGTKDFDVVIQSGQPTYPHNPMVTSDFSNTLYSGDGGSKNTSSFTFSGYNNVSLNTSGISWISKTGDTKLCVRSSKEIAYLLTVTDIYVYGYEKGAGYRPTLYVTYSSSGAPTVTTNPATYVTRTTAQLNGYLNADGGEADTVSFNVQPWYSTNWRDCIEFTINASYVDADLTNFPVLVTGSQLNTTDTDFWTTVNSSGSDILFTNSAGTKLNRELVSINATNKTLECYVNVTAIDDTVNTKFYMYYNSANISLYNESNSTSTWDANYVAVWHMNDNSSSNASILDSTRYVNNGTKVEANGPLQIDSSVFSGDKSQSFDSTNDKITVTNTSSVNNMFDAGGSLEIIQDSSGVYVLAKRNPGWNIGIQTRPTFLKDFSTSDGQWRTTTVDWPATYAHTSMSYNASTNSSTPSFYLNGSLKTTAALLVPVGTTSSDSAVNLVIGTDGATYNSINISEIRLSNTSRASEWFKASYYSLMLPTSFAPVTDVFTSTTTQSKNTGDSYYISQTGLTANTLYGYKSEAVNSYGTSWGAWVLFNTTVTLNPPFNVLCNADSTSIALSWTKGGNSSYTYIRYKTGGYPTSSTDGNAVANQSGVNFNHTGLASGTSYYYRLWGEDGGAISTTNVTTMCTTLAGSSVATPAPLPTVNFSGGDTVPNGSALTNNPLYTLGNQEAAAISVPQGTWWMLVGLGILLVTGLFIFTRSRNLLLSLGAMIIAGVIMANMGMFPIWIMWVFGLAGIGMSWKELR